MRIGASLALIALGAILKFAITTDSTHGFNIETAGVILMIVGALGLVITLIWMSMRRRTEVVHRGPAGTTGSTVVTPNDPLDSPY
jgi:membrane-bound ClpP family serine protease